MDKLAELRRKLGALTDELNSDAIISDAALFDAKEAEIRATTEAIARLETAQQRAAALAKPAIGVHGAAASGAEAAADAGARTMSAMANELAALPRRSGQKPDFSDAISVARRGLNFGLDTSRHFRSFGEQLQAIANYYTSRGSNTDGRLVRAPTGAGEVDPTGGGFLVQVDFAAAVFMIAHNMGEILSRVNKIPISANANGLKIPGVDETSRATGSRWGGVQSNWAAEGIAGTESRPKFRLIEFDLKKLISKMTMTDELLQDSTALTAIASQAFSEEIMFMTEDAIFEGTGAGQPLGIINSGALVTVAKQTGQAAATIVKENIDAMWSRMAPRSRKNAIWLINQDIEPQLNQMNQAVGTGGQLVYLPPGGIANAPNATLYGRELVATEYNSALGAVGDIALVDLSQYTIVDKGGVQMATSMHVAFDTDEMRFRITYRVDGKPMWAAPVTPFKGSLTKSPFVALAAR
ncbi:phage major capsid protein [Rhodoblastus sp. 17X3]|uniref:phage major capsid protein n=1 Tax=Rhodoblastus sp. 17X3 TaxID=3047026 RepID=UPI0024B6AD48|nr:phage major capsid protein [Rhodoblastus sp. 17X3]MDI9847363.1 phage major capsid protein [Rhodoblastus sp. 17X3]